MFFIFKYQQDIWIRLSLRKFDFFEITFVITRAINIPDIAEATPFIIKLLLIKNNIILNYFIYFKFI